MKREDKEEIIMKHEKYLKPVFYNKSICNKLKSSQKNENKINEAKITFFKLRHLIAYGNSNPKMRSNLNADWLPVTPL